MNDEAKPHPRHRTALAALAFFITEALTFVLMMAVSDSSFVTLIVELLLSSAVARYVWMHADDKNGLRRIVYSGLVFGGIGLLLGLFGPHILAPGAQAGFLPAFLITCPFGALLGIGYGILRNQRPKL
jgi:MFS family permease